MKSTTSTPNKYPASDEKTTLIDRRIFVISLKSEITEGTTTEVFVLLKTILLIAFYLRVQRYALNLDYTIAIQLLIKILNNLRMTTIYLLKQARILMFKLKIVTS